MNWLTKNAALDTLGLPSGDHWVRFHVEGDNISFVVASSIPQNPKSGSSGKPTGFVQRWSGSAKKLEAEGDHWLAHINEKHLR